MNKANIKGMYHRLTLATSDEYPQQERLLSLKECFDELAKDEHFLSKEEVSEIVDFVQSVLTRHVGNMKR
jgi:hypothetical protein